MAKSTNWIVVTDQERPIEAIAKELAAAGFSIRDVLEEVGSITGSAESKLVQRLRKVKGVAEISPDTQIDLGPPDADVTW